jgi:hypothetical protein
LASNLIPSDLCFCVSRIIGMSHLRLGLLLCLSHLFIYISYLLRTDLVILRPIKTSDTEHRNPRRVNTIKKYLSVIYFQKA